MSIIIHTKVTQMIFQIKIANMPTDKEWEDKIKKFMSDIERVRDGHMMEYNLRKVDGEVANQISDMHYNKAKAYDFVIRKLKRNFKID